MKKMDSVWRVPAFAVIRHPVMSCSSMQRMINCEASDLASTVRSMLEDRWVDEALAIASPSLHGRVKQWLAGDGDFSAVERVVARYLIRMSFRATPFGAFSCVTTWHSIQPRGEMQSIDLRPWPCLPSREDMRKIVDLDSRMVADLAAIARRARSGRMRYFLNDTLYERAEDYVFIARGSAGCLPATPYHAVSADKSGYLAALIDLCGKGSTRELLVQEISNRFPSETPEDCEAFVSDAIDRQILVADHLHPVVSENGLSSLTESLKAEAEMASLLSGVSDLISPARAQVTALDVLEKEVADRLSTTVQVQGQTPAIKVDLAGELRDHSALDPAAIAERISGVVSRIVRLRRSTNLDAFASRFSDRFGESEVPLMDVAEMLEVLGFSHKVLNPPLVRRIVGPGAPSAGRKRKAASRLDPFELMSVLAGNDLYVDISSKLPPAGEGCSADLLVWVAAWGVESNSQASSVESSVLEIQKVGRTSGNRMLGRFAGASAVIRGHLTCDEDPDGPMIAELLHLPHPRLGNVCSRVALTQWHVGIRAGAPQDSALLLRDLTLRVSGGRLKLRSKSHGRDVLLQMSNAHAYQDAPSVPLYRFLATVANQGDYAEIPNLRVLAPNAAFVPGLICDGVVISRASWRVPAEFCMRLAKLSKAEARHKIRALASADRWPSPLALAIGDQVAPFNLDQDWMVDELATELKRTKGAEIKEVYLNGMPPGMRGEEGASFHEILVPLTSKFSARRDEGHSVMEDWKDVVRSPWSDWAYLKLYVRPSNQDHLLRKLAPLLNRGVADGVIDRYFYIRYADEGGEHIRLRLNRRSGAMAAAWTILGEAFGEFQRLGLLISVGTDTYVREVARYGGARTIGHCESIFCMDSVLSTEYIQAAADTGISWEVGVALLDHMIELTGLPSTAQRLNFARKVSSKFQAEFKFDAAQKRRIGYAFKSLPNTLAEMRLARPASRTESSCHIADHWTAIAATPGLTQDQIHRIRWSLVHMRANRIFNSMPRMQEAIVFDLLRRVYERDVAIGSKSACPDRGDS